MKTLPWLGLGISSNMNAKDEPHPYRLWAEHPKIFDFVEYSAPLDFEAARGQASLFEAMLQHRSEVPVLFHPVHLNLYGPELQARGDLELLSAHAKAVGSPWVGNDVAWWHVQGRAFPGYLYIAPPMTPAGLADCVAHALHVQGALDVSLALENPVTSTPEGPLHVLDFMAQLHVRTGCPLLLDLGHLFGFQLASGLPLQAGLDGFPLDQVVELHLAGGVATGRGERRAYADDHTQPIREELFGLLEEILPKCRNLRAVTLEADGHPRDIAALELRRIRPLLQPREAQRQWAVSNPNPPSELFESQSRPWELFQKAFAEDDYRLAVIAQEVDGAWPAARLLVAGEPHALRDFSSSPEFRASFERGEGDLKGAFGTYARRRVRERRDEAAAAALAFETWAWGLHTHEKPPGLDEVALGEGVFLRSFPFDLSEMYFAVKALRRHLEGRAWGSGGISFESLDSLRQIALRPAKGPWTVLVLKKGSKLEVQTPPKALMEILRLAAEGGLYPEFMNKVGSPKAVAEALAAGWVRKGGE